MLYSLSVEAATLLALALAAAAPTVALAAPAVAVAAAAAAPSTAAVGTVLTTPLIAPVASYDLEPTSLPRFEVPSELLLSAYSERSSVGSTAGNSIPDTAMVVQAVKIKSVQAPAKGAFKITYVPTPALVNTDNDGQADVLLVDTTGDGVTDALGHIWGTDSAPQQSAPPKQQSAPRQALGGRHLFGGGSGSGSGHGRGRTATTATATTATATTATAAAATVAGRGIHAAAAAPHGQHPKVDGASRHGWTREEDEAIVALVLANGEKWSPIAAVLPGRTFWSRFSTI